MKRCLTTETKRRILSIDSKTNGRDAMAHEANNRIMMYCPLCGQTHELERKSRIASMTIKDEHVDYEECFFVCNNSVVGESEFETGKMVDSNLLNARNAYRRKKGLLTTDEIIGIRENYGLSQVDLAKLLGWGEATISRYESKAIQDEAYDTMLRLVKDNPLQAIEFLDKNSAKFTVTKEQEIRKRMIARLDAYGKEFLSRQALEGEYVSYNEPSDENGFTPLNIDKIEAVVSYAAERVSKLYKVKLMKLLWYMDALSCKRHGHAITGLVYRHNTMGALPVGHKSLLNLERINVVEEESMNYEYMLHVYPSKNMDYLVLSKEDKAVLDEVIERFKTCEAKEMIEYMHEEKAYAETEAGEIIPFSLAKEIRDFRE